MATWGLRWTFAVVLAALAALLMPDTARADGCTPGQQTGCVCAGGEQGFQVCDDAGKRYGPCECAAQDESEPAEDEPGGETAEPPAAGATNTGIVRVHSTAPGTVYVNHGAKWPAKWGQVGRVEREPLRYRASPQAPTESRWSTISDTARKRKPLSPKGACRKSGSNPRRRTTTTSA